MSAPKQKPIKIKVGCATVKVYRVMTRGCESFQVADYSSGKRKLISFSEEDKARGKATEIAVKLGTVNATALALTKDDVDAYARSLALLKPLGISFETAIIRYVESIKILGEDVLLKAADDYARRNRKNAPSKTVDEVFKEIVEDAKTRNLSARYIEDLNGRCGRFAKSFKVPITSITSAEIRQFLADLKLSGRSHNNYLGAIKRLFEFAKERGYLPRDHDELAGIGIIKRTDSEIEVFTPDEMARLLTAAAEEFLPVLAIGAFTGLRSAEIERLDWSEISFPQKYVKVTAGKGKTASRRIVPISDNMAQWLARHAQRTGKVWPFTHAYLHECMRKTAAATEVKADETKGIKKKEPVVWKHNALRHSFISYRLASIQNAAQVALEAGNSPQMIFRHYRELVTVQDAKDWFAITPKIA